MEGYNYFKCPTYGSDEYNYNQYLGNHINKQNKGSRGKDTERLKTYRAEWKFQSQIDEGSFDTIEEAQKYAKRIYKSKKWQKLWLESVEDDALRLLGAQPKVVAMNRRNKKMSGYTDGFTVTLDMVSGCNKYTLLHELAHCLGHMHHGRSFRRVLLELVGAFMGTKEKKILKSEFKKHKLSFGNARKPLSFEKWMESKKRMEQMRWEKEFRADCLAMHERMKKYEKVST